MAEKTLRLYKDPTRIEMMLNDKNPEYRGLCPICDRPMYELQGSINRHHFVPKSKGGKEQEFAHTICHNQIHALWSETELARQYSDPELIRADPDMQKFIKWVQKKDPLFYEKTRRSNRRK